MFEIATLRDQLFEKHFISYLTSNDIKKLNKKSKTIPETKSNFNVKS